MPSVIVSAASGSPFPLVSGNFWSGNTSLHPCGGVQLKASPLNSGHVYVSLSGGGTITSGSYFLSGVNTTDGMFLAPGDTYFVPKLAMASGGYFNLFVTCDAAASGQGRLFYEVF